MKASNLLLATLREPPKDAEIISHKLMLRAGMIRKLASGLYTWLPVGLRVLKKVETIVREEMNAIHAQEILMPAIQPSEALARNRPLGEIWAHALKNFRSQFTRICFGPTHEEVVTDLVRT